MNSKITAMEKVLTVAVSIFCTTILIATPWPSAHQVFNPHSPSYVNR